MIPVFDHERAIGPVVSALQSFGLRCILVDDGSGSACAQVLDGLAVSCPDVLLLRLPVNLGKGGAVSAGLRRAGALGYTHVLQIDADGQHTAADVPAFLASSCEDPEAVICGLPVFDASMPPGRFFSRYLTHVLVWIHTLSRDIPDSMCGFRIYPLAAVLPILDREHPGSRMDFDIAILVRLHWRGVRCRWIPTRVRYPADGLSHFRLGLDNLLISRMHVRLFLGMLWRLPRLLARRLGGASAAADGGE